MKTIQTAVEHFKAGGMLIVTDHPYREHEGDLIMAAEKVTPSAINFMIKEGGGLVCLAMAGSEIDRLGLGFMDSQRHPNDQTTPFTMSIDAKHGTTTGISATERAHTILTAISPQSSAQDFIKPGHIFPLRANDRGVLGRPGHTEAAVDLARLAGLRPGGVICEIIGKEGTMLRGKALEAYANHWQIPMIAIDDLIAYREQLEMIPQDPWADSPHPHHRARVSKEATCHLETPFGPFELSLYEDRLQGQEHLVLSKGDLSTTANPLVRLHSACLTGEVFHSLHCDCQQQLSQAMEKIAHAPAGLIIYLNQEGRGIGLKNKIMAYQLQAQGHDTVSANQALGLPIDCRDYSVAADILRSFNFQSIQLLTNNPAKVTALETALGLPIIRVAHQIPNPPPKAQHYLNTKRQHLGHWLEEGL